ncbi:hypothetical protein [Helicobacter pylori]|uniref:hypothetical protein n=1 Tax=Helicobacter pylori TaxID=210 RepID=UPI003F93DC80
MKYSPTTPKTKSPNPIRVRYEKACWCRLFYFDCEKHSKGINLITDTPVKRPIALAIGLPDVGGEFGSHSVSLMDFTEFDLQRIPYSSHASYLIRA